MTVGTIEDTASSVTFDIFVVVEFFDSFSNGVAVVVLNAFVVTILGFSLDSGAAVVVLLYRRIIAGFTSSSPEKNLLLIKKIV